MLTALWRICTHYGGDFYTIVKLQRYLFYTRMVLTSHVCSVNIHQYNMCTTPQMCKKVRKILDL